MLFRLLVFARLALLEVSIHVGWLVLLLGSSNAAWAIDSLLLRELLLAESLIRGGHLRLVVWPLALLRPRLLQLLPHINLRSRQTYQSNLALRVWPRLELRTLTALKLRVLHLLPLSLVPLAVSGPLLELYLVSLRGASFVRLDLDDCVVVHFAELSLLVWHSLQDGGVLLGKPIEFDFVAPVHLRVSVLLALLLLGDLDYFLGEQGA